MPGNVLGAVSCPGDTNPCPFSIQVDMWLGTDYGGGMMNVTVTNEGKLAILGMSVTDPVQTSLPNATFGGFATFTPFTYDGTVVGGANQLVDGKSSSGYYSFLWGGASYTPYTITVSATLSTGKIVTEQTSFEADAGTDDAPTY